MIRTLRRTILQWTLTILRLRAIALCAHNIYSANHDDPSTLMCVTKARLHPNIYDFAYKIGYRLKIYFQKMLFKEAAAADKNLDPIG